ncbi:MAG: substrate-binding domain-containing protein [Phycisphaerae bacterium]
MTAMRQILFLGNLSIGYNRDILRGIGDYAVQDRNLHIMFPTDFEPTSTNSLNQLAPSGVIAGACPQFGQLLSRLIGSGTPAVDVSAERETAGLPRITTDDQAMGAMAAEYFINRGFKNLVYYGMAARHWSAMRWRGFQKRGQQEDVKVRHFDRPTGTANHQAGLFPCPVADWIKSLHHPSAIFAGDDLLGAELLYTCQLLDIKVPEELAILGVGNEDLYGVWRNNRLSSVVLNTAEIGRRAIETLNRLMEHRAPLSATIQIPPIRIVTRFSTDIFGVSDELVRRALELIHKQFGSGISVKGLAYKLAVSRPTLERRFTSALGRSPAVEISRVQADFARRRLLDSNQCVEKVAEEAGYACARQLRAALDQHFGTTPRELRKLRRT